MADNGQLLKKVAEIYDGLDFQISSNSDLAGTCQVCGKCCDFAEFDLRLFVTPAELMYLAANLSSKKQRPMTTSRCPYNTDSRCVVYEYRFAGCRIFCCRGDADFQSKLSESTLEKFKSLCTEFQIPYHYIELAAALNNFAGA